MAHVAGKVGRPENHDSAYGESGYVVLTTGLVVLAGSAAAQADQANLNTQAEHNQALALRVMNPDGTAIGTASSGGTTTNDVLVQLQNDQILNDPLRVDEASPTVTYIGYATAGTLNAAATWAVKRITTSGAITTIEWADGDKAFDNIWDNRASLTYS